MLTFYVSLVREIPSVLRGTVEAAAFWILSVVVPAAVFFFPEWGPMTESAEFSRWFALVSVALSLVYGMLRVNYVKFKGLEQSLDDANKRLTPTLLPAINMMPRQSDGGRWFYLRVVNTATVRAERCRGCLKELYAIIDGERYRQWVTGVHLNWAYGSGGGVEADIQGEAWLVVGLFDPTKPDEVTVQHNGTSKVVLLANHEYELVIELSSANVAPRTDVYALKPTESDQAPVLEWRRNAIV